MYLQVGSFANIVKEDSGGITYALLHCQSPHKKRKEKHTQKDDDPRKAEAETKVMQLWVMECQGFLQARQRQGESLPWNIQREQDPGSTSVLD